MLVIRPAVRDSDTGTEPSGQWIATFLAGGGVAATEYRTRTTR